MKIKVSVRNGFVHLSVQVNGCWQTVVHSETEEKAFTRVVEIDVKPTIGDIYETHSEG